MNHDNKLLLTGRTRGLVALVAVLLATFSAAACRDDDSTPPAPDGGVGLDSGEPRDLGARTDAGCAPTGVACDPACPASGVLPGGAPCTAGNFDPATCVCEPLADVDGGTVSDAGICPPTGVACTPTCPASGMLPGGAPCVRGNFDAATCICEPIADADAGICPPTGVACTPTCPASGMLPGGAPCTRGNFDAATCTCVPLGG